MNQKVEQTIGIDELSNQTAVQLPCRHLLATVSVLGLPLVGVSDVAVLVDTSGPGWLVGSLGQI